MADDSLPSIILSSAAILIALGRTPGRPGAPGAPGAPGGALPQPTLAATWAPGVLGAYWPERWGHHTVGQGTVSLSARFRAEAGTWRLQTRLDGAVAVGQVITIEPWISGMVAAGWAALGGPIIYNGATGADITQSADYVLPAPSFMTIGINAGGALAHAGQLLAQLSRVL